MTDLSSTSNATLRERRRVDDNPDGLGVFFDQQGERIRPVSEIEGPAMKSPHSRDASPSRHPLISAQSATTNPTSLPMEDAEIWESIRNDAVVDDQIQEHVRSQIVNEKLFDVGGIPAADPSLYEQSHVQAEESLDPGFMAGSMEKELDQRPDETPEEHAKRLKAFRVYTSPLQSSDVSRCAAMEGKDMEHTDIFNEWDEKWTPPLLPDFRLMDHQKLAVAFLQAVRRERTFALIGDDMGIGKVTQLSDNILICKDSPGSHLSMDCCDRKQFQARPSPSDTVSVDLVHLLLIIVDVSPNSLAPQWIAESKKFFPKTELQLMDFSSEAFSKNLSSRTVWVVRDHNLQRFADFVKYNGGISIPALIADEAHIYLRSHESAKVRGYRSLLEQSQFSVLMSGTLFPLGPQHDVFLLFPQLGGPLEASNERWPRGFVAEINKLRDNWNVLKLRNMIQPFYLRRTKTSTWENERIVPADIQSPIPFLEDPEDPEDTNGSHYRQALDLLADLDDQKRGKTSGRIRGAKSTPLTDQSHSASNQERRRQVFQRAEMKRTGYSAITARANTARMLAWSKIYREWQSIENGLETSAEKAKQQTRLIKTEYAKRRPSCRVFKLVQLLKMIHKRKERFLIVSDRLFLLSIATQVLSFPLHRQS
jgi:SNF2-related domain